MPKYTLEQLQQTRQILVDYGYANSVARIDIEIEKAKRPQAELDFLERFGEYAWEKSLCNIYDEKEELPEAVLDFLKEHYDFLAPPETSGQAASVIKDSYNSPHDAPELLLLEDYEGDQWFRIGERAFWRDRSNSKKMFTLFQVEDEFAPYKNKGWVPDGTTFWDDKEDELRTVRNNSGFDSMYVV